MTTEVNSESAVADTDAADTAVDAMPVIESTASAAVAEGLEQANHLSDAAENNEDDSIGNVDVNINIDNEGSSTDNIDKDADASADTDSAVVESELDASAIALVLEAALFSQPEPMSLVRMRALFSKEQSPSNAMLQSAIEKLMVIYQDRAVSLQKTSSGYRFQTQLAYAPYLQRLQEKKPPKASRAYMETLSIIAYRQPVTRGEIEQIRGVAVNSQIIKNLLDRSWIKVAGYRDVPGKPALLATTKVFLDDFSLASLKDLPPLQVKQDLDKAEAKLQSELQLGLAAAADGAVAAEDVADDVPAGSSTGAALLSRQLSDLSDVDALLEQADAVTERVAAADADANANADNDVSIDTANNQDAAEDGLEVTGELPLEDTVELLGAEQNEQDKQDNQSNHNDPEHAADDSV